jgi:4-hydroxy-2-oxoheptanedioate aldolase
MTVLEEKMVNLLVDLKKNHGVVAVKGEFESEGARINEIMRLKDVASKAGLGLAIKIGGGEAITDMLEAQNIGVDILIAPMIESAYAAKKCLKAIVSHFDEDVRKNMHFGINIETQQGYENFSEITKLPILSIIDTIVLGRSDMCCSLGLGKGDINIEKICDIAEKLFASAKKKGFYTTMGGGMSPDSIPLIKKLVSQKLLNKFESRKIVFSTEKINFSTLKDGINKANKFEYLWLKNKRNYYYSIYNEDKARIEDLKKRLSN